jgi:hypothetical protein
LLGLMASVYAEDDSQLDQSQARFLYFNTSSTATSLTLLGALILLGVIFYLVYVGGLLNTNSYNRNGYGQYESYDNTQYDQYNQAQYR